MKGVNRTVNHQRIGPKRLTKKQREFLLDALDSTYQGSKTGSGVGVEILSEERKTAESLAKHGLIVIERQTETYAGGAILTCAGIHRILETLEGRRWIMQHAVSESDEGRNPLAFALLMYGRKSLLDHYPTQWGESPFEE